MIELPWQVVAVFAGLFAIQLILSHIKKASCEERLEAAVNQTRRNTMATYREAYQAGLREGETDGRAMLRSDDNDS